MFRTMVSRLRFQAKRLMKPQLMEFQMSSKPLILRPGEINAKLYISGFAEKYRAYVSPKGKPSVTSYEVLGVFRRRGQVRGRLRGEDKGITKNYLVVWVFSPLAKRNCSSVLLSQMFWRLVVCLGRRCWQADLR